MRVAVIDVGSNTARLLVANVTANGAVVPVAEERELPAPRGRDRANGDPEHEEDRRRRRHLWRLRPPDRRARRRASSTVIVTAPGRQGAAAPELTAALAEATSLPRAGADGREPRAASPTTVPLPRPSEICPRSSPSSTSAAARPRSSSARRSSGPPGSGRPISARCVSPVPTSRTIRRRRRQIGAAAEAVARALSGMSPPHAVARTCGRRERSRALEDRRPPLRRG